MMPKKYINPEILRSRFTNGYDDYFPLWKIEMFIDDAPAVDVEEVKHGEWINDADDIYWGNYIVKKHCSECGYTPKFDREAKLFDLTKYCPECGAKMDGKESSNET